MEKRRLGRTELNVTAVSLGALPLQRCDIQEAGIVLDAAIDAGINFIDTARFYTDSEEKIGNSLWERRSDFYLASKSMARNYSGMVNDINTSLELLRTHDIDIYQIHSIKKQEDIDAVFASSGALKALEEAKAAGKIRFIGITGHRVDLLIQAIATNRFDTVQVPYNYLEQEAAKELFPLARRLDMGIIVMKPIGGGYLTQANLSLRWILNEPDIVTIPGMDRVEQIDQNVAAADPWRPLNTEELKSLEKEAELAAKEFCHRCRYCMPCKVGIEIDRIFIFRVQYQRYRMTTAIPTQYAELPVKASACIGCGACEKRCPYDIPIRKWLREMAELMGE